MSLKSKIPKISNQITEQLDLRQIQPFFVTSQCYHEVWATISPMEFVKNKRVVRFE